MRLLHRHHVASARGPRRPPDLRRSMKVVPSVSPFLGSSTLIVAERGPSGKSRRLGMPFSPSCAAPGELVYGQPQRLSLALFLVRGNEFLLS